MTSVPGPPPGGSWVRVPPPRPAASVAPSPVFLLLLAVTALGGWAAWTDAVDRRLAVIVFVLAGWIVSLCLHEFAHALAGYLGGDHSVVDKGYLSLNPLRYADRSLSLVLPLVFLLLGGIGLPGGAVWIDQRALRGRANRSLVALAGPLTNALLAVLVLAPFRLGWVDFQTNPVFAAALAFLGLLEVTATILNLLPVPGLDGFGVIEPYLSRQTLATLAPVRQYSLFILFILLFWLTPVNDVLWRTAYSLAGRLGADPGVASAGLRLFQFWRYR